MKRYEMFMDENFDYISKVIASFLNEEINIIIAPEGSSCNNCYWHKIDSNICKAPFHYIGMQLYDCLQYKPQN